MATRSKATAEKRRKEMARKEKQRMKAERRAQRKLLGLPEGDDSFEMGEAGGEAADWADISDMSDDATDGDPAADALAGAAIAGVKDAPAPKPAAIPIPHTVVESKP